MRPVHDQVVQAAVAGARRAPVAEQDAVRPGRGLEHDLAALGDQDPRFGPASARLHVLGEDQELIARGLDDRVEIAAEHERRRLERLLVGHLDHVYAGKLELLQLVVGLDRLVPGIAGDRDGPGGIGRDQADVERLDASRARSSCGSKPRR